MIAGWINKLMNTIAVCDSIMQYYKLYSNELAVYMRAKIYLIAE